MSFISISPMQALQSLLRRQKSLWAVKYPFGWMKPKISAPTVNTAITNGTAYIDGMAGSKEAKDLADKINAGSLPFALTVDDSKLQMISPSLGSDALRVMLIAGAIAFGIVCLIMIILYRVNGVVAAIALLLWSACGKYRLHFGLLPECGQLYTYRSGHCGYHSVGRRGR